MLDMNMELKDIHSQAPASAINSIAVEPTGTQEEEENVVLEPKVGLMGSIGLIVGIIIGSGIFISPTGVADGAGSVGLSLVLWGVGGVITLFGALSMTELGTMISRSGGEYTYIRMGLAGWLAYMWAWTQCFLLKPSAKAVVMLTCANYILTPVFSDDCGEPPEMYKKILAATLVLLVALINIWSVRLANNIQVIFLVAKVLALIIIIIGGIVNIINGKTQYLKTGFEGTKTNPGEIMLGLYSAMFAYDGWNNLNSVMSEVINPAWTLPMAMYIGIPLVIVLYMMTNVSYFTVMDVEGLLSSPAVAMTWAESVIPQVAWLIPLSVAMSTFGNVNGSIFSVARLFYTAAKGKDLPRIVSYIHIKRVTPMPGIIITTFFTILYSLLGQVTALIDFLSFAIWLFYGVTMVCLLVMRFKEPFKSMNRPFRVPIIFPIIVLAFAVAMVVIPIATAPQIEFLYATIIMLAGLIFYFPFIYCRIKPSCMNSVTMFLQLVMQVVPPSDLDDDDYTFDVKSQKSDKTE